MSFFIFYLLTGFYFWLFFTAGAIKARPKFKRRWHKIAFLVLMLVAYLFLWPFAAIDAYKGAIDELKDKR